MEAGGFPARLRAVDPLVRVDLATRRADPVGHRWANRHVLQAAAVLMRRRFLAEASAWLAGHPRGSRARYAVVTGGARVEVDGVRDRLRDLHRRISLWRRDVCAPAGIDLVLRASELTRDEDGLYHTRANCLLLPLRRLDRPGWIDFLAASHAHLGHRWHDAGQVRDLREVVKYCLKPADLAAAVARPAELAELARQVERVRMVEALGEFRRWRRELRGEGLRMVRAGGVYALALTAPAPRGREAPASSPPANAVVGVQAGTTLYPVVSVYALVRGYDAATVWRPGGERERAAGMIERHLAARTGLDREELLAPARAPGPATAAATVSKGIVTGAAIPSAPTAPRFADSTNARVPVAVVDRGSSDVQSKSLFLYCFRK